MRIEELKTFVTKLKSHIDTTKIIQHEQNLINILSQNIQPNNNRQPLDPHKTNFYNCLVSFEFNTLSLGEIEISKIYKINELLGEDVKLKFIETFRDERIDPAGILKSLNDHFTQLNNINNLFTQLATGLKQFNSSKDIELKKDQGKLLVHFTNKAKINNITDFYKWIETWNTILRGFTVASNLQPESVTITYVQKSSPLVMELMIFIGVINLIGGATLLILKNIDKFLEIKIKIKEIEEMEIPESKEEILSLLRNSLEKFEHSVAEKIINELKTEIKSNDTEKLEHLKMGINKLFKFLSEGGMLEEKIHSLTENKNEELKNDDTITKTKELYSEIRKISTKIENEQKLIE